MSSSILRKVAVKIASRLQLGAASVLLGSDPSRNFSNQWYIRHNQRRQEHLASLSLPLFHRTVIETGAGIGDHTSFFIDRGCKITVTEPREDNLNILRSRYPDLNIVQLDLDNPDYTPAGKFELVYCYGTLYHLCRPALAIKYLSEQCSDLFLLETCVSPGNELDEHLIKEDENIPSQAFSGTGCRPTRTWLQSELKKHFPYVYFPLTQPCHPEFPLDWSKPNENTLNRAIVIASRSRLDNPLLSEEIPAVQTWFVAKNA